MSSNKKKQKKEIDKSANSKNTEHTTSGIHIKKAQNPQSSLLLSENFQPVSETPMKSNLFTFITCVVCGGLVGSMPLGYMVYKENVSSSENSNSPKIMNLLEKIEANQDKLSSELGAANRQIKEMSKNIEEIETKLNFSKNLETPKAPKRKK